MEEQATKLIITIDGKQYDLSDYADKHPGGRKILERAEAMPDAGEMFRNIGHSEEALRIKETYLISKEVPEHYEEEADNVDVVAEEDGISKQDHNEKAVVYNNDDQINPQRRWMKHLVIVILSLLWAIIVNATTQSGAGFWEDFLLQYPATGEAGHGKFIIRGASRRGMDYPWRLAQPRMDATILAWVLCIVHVGLQWIVVYLASRAKEKALREEGIPKYSDQLNKWNYAMMGVNALCILLGYVHKKVYYDGLAGTISEAVAQNAVVFYLSVVLLMETPRRGIFFRWGKGFFKLSQECQTSFLQFLKVYHGYLFSLAFTVNYHYQAIESTSSHFFGYFYQMLLIFQGTLIFDYSHKDRSWTFWLESLVLLHAVGVAIIQNVQALCMFTFGFALVTLVTQIWGLPMVEQVLFAPDCNPKWANLARAVVGIVWIIPVAFCGAAGLFNPGMAFFIPLGLAILYMVVPFLFWIGYKIYHGFSCNGNNFCAKIFLVTYGIGATVLSFVTSVALLGGSAPGLYKFATPECGEIFFDNETSVVLAEPGECYI